MSILKAPPLFLSECFTRYNISKCYSPYCALLKKSSFYYECSLEKGFIYSMDNLDLPLQVWARNRSSIYAHDCLNGYLLSVILSYLATESGGNVINKSMSAMQIFRVTLKFIGTNLFFTYSHHSLCVNEKL